MRGAPCIGNITNRNEVVATLTGFKGVLSFAGSGRRDTAVFSTAAEAETALAGLRKEVGIDAALFN